VDFLVLVALFFAVRWQARDIYNNLKISLSLLMVLGYIGYALVYAALAFTVFPKTGATGRAKAFGGLAMLWILMWLVIWAVILALSEPKAKPLLSSEDQLTPPKPTSDLARGTIVTSIDACNRLANCENSSAHRNYLDLVNKQVKCEACMASNMCPMTGGDGRTECTARTSRAQCTRACVPTDLAERYARDKSCPNAVAYARLTGDVGDIAAVCKEDRGLCMYGCDTSPDLQNGVCSTGWRSYEDEDLGTVLSEVEANMGYPSEAKCKQKHAYCAPHACAPAPIAPPATGAPNCYCEHVYAHAQEPPCQRLDGLCDRTSPQYAAAIALRRSYVVQDDIKTIDDGKLATGVRATDQSLSTALRF
jgi:hypothetical protein